MGRGVVMMAERTVVAAAAAEVTVVATMAVEVTVVVTMAAAAVWWRYQRRTQEMRLNRISRG